MEGFNYIAIGISISGSIIIILVVLIIIFYFLKNEKDKLVNTKAQGSGEFLRHQFSA